MNQLTTFEKCKAIRRAILSAAGESTVYENWSGEDCAGKIREIPRRALNKFGPVNIAELTKSELELLDFYQWDEGNPLMLIPIWLFPFLPERINVKCINGSTVATKKHIDTDCRGGYLAYGVVPRA